jgi:hypothetical protein
MVCAYVLETSNFMDARLRVRMSVHVCIRPVTRMDCASTRWSHWRAHSTGRVTHRNALEETEDTEAAHQPQHLVAPRHTIIHRNRVHVCALPADMHTHDEGGVVACR